MALVLIQLQDRPDGVVDVQVVAEPPLSELQASDPATFSVAQKLGAVALNAIHAELKDQGPRLVLAGADEMPH